MPATKPSARERMVVSAAILMREKGARATSIDDVLAHSGAPRGSVYHHFPGGREELIAEAVAYARDFVSASIDRIGGDPLAVFDALAGWYRAELERSELRSGCPVAAVAIESREDDASVQETAGKAFAVWQSALEVRLSDAGVAAEPARELAATLVAGIEGALMLARSRRSIQHFDDVAKQLRGLIEAELEKARRSG